MRNRNGCVQNKTLRLRMHAARKQHSSAGFFFDKKNRKTFTFLVVCFLARLNVENQFEFADLMVVRVCTRVVYVAIVSYSLQLH